MTGLDLSAGHGRETAVSEVIGAVMLITLVVAAVAIISMVLFSQATPQEIPNVNFMTGSDGKAPPQMLYLFHNGGDALHAGDFEVVLDGVSKPYTVEGGDTYWSLGERLDIDISTMASLPKQVTLVYNSTTGGSTAIRSASVDLSATPVVINTDTRITPTPTPTPVYSFNEVFSRNYSRVSRPSVGTDYSKYFAIELTSSGRSWIITNSRGSSTTKVTYDLTAGNRLKITLNTGTTYFKAFGRNGQLWNISARGVNVTVYTPSNSTWVPLFSTNNRNFYDAWIDGCKDIGSTLSIENSSATIAPTTLIINDTAIITGNDGNNVVISRIHPIDKGAFALQEISSTIPSVFFAGFAENTTVNGVECNNIACAGLLP